MINNNVNVLTRKSVDRDVEISLDSVRKKPGHTDLSAIVAAAWR